MKLSTFRFQLSTLLLLASAAAGFAASAPYVPATQAEVNAGVNRWKGVTPATLSGYAGGPTNGQTSAQVTNIARGLDLALSNSIVSLGGGQTWGLFGVAFNGGQVGWPPTNPEEVGKFVYSPDGVNWIGGLGQSQLTGPRGYMRDPALARAGGVYVLAITDNLSTNHSTNIAYCISSNLIHYGTWTNLSFKLTGETYTFASNYVWSPVLTLLGSNLVMNVSVSTNNGLSFHQRYSVASTNALNTWSTPAVLNNQTGRTNIIDLTPYYDETANILYAWYKNEASAYMELGRFDSVDISSAFRPVLTNDHSGWSSAIEGNWMVKTPAGKFRVYGVRYVNQAGGYGNNGQGQQLFFAESSSVTNGWSAMTNANTPFYMQSFKPLVLRTVAEQCNALAAATGNNQLRGTVNIEGRIGATLSGIKFRGLAFTNPFPASQPTGMVTNDFAAINFGTEGSSAGGIYAKGDGTLRLYVPTYVYGNSNDVIQSYVQDVVTLKSNSATFHVQLVGDGSGLTGVTASSAGGSATTLTTFGVLPDYALGLGSTSLGWQTNISVCPSLNMPGFVMVAGSGGFFNHALQPRSMNGYKTNISNYYFGTTNSTSGSLYHSLFMANYGALTTTNAYVTLVNYACTNASVISVSITNTSGSPWTAVVGTSKIYLNSVPTNMWFMGGNSIFY